jgi:hypothetical protein
MSQEAFDKLMQARDEAVSRLASISNYVKTHEADSAADDLTTNDEYEAAIDRVVSAQQNIRDFSNNLEKRKRS